MDRINPQCFHSCTFNAELNCARTNASITASDKKRVLGFVIGSGGQPCLKCRNGMRTEGHDSSFTPFPQYASGTVGEIQILDMSSTEAMQMVVTGGVVVPGGLGDLGK